MGVAKSKPETEANHSMHEIAKDMGTMRKSCATLNTPVACTWIGDVADHEAWEARW